MKKQTKKTAGKKNAAKKKNNVGGVIDCGPKSTSFMPPNMTGTSPVWCKAARK